MIDNFDKIKDFLEWRSDDDFYFLQILQRKKDHKEGKVNGTNNNSRLIKAYYIKNLDYFEFIKPEVIELCKLFNARAGINLNRRSFQRMALQHLKKVTDQLLNKSYDKAHKAYSSVVGAYNDDSDKKWIIDIDSEQLPFQTDIRLIINGCMPLDEKVIATLSSKSGVHIITNPFNVQEFEDKWALHIAEYGFNLGDANGNMKVEIHKNNPTNIFIP